MNAFLVACTLVPLAMLGPPPVALASETPQVTRAQPRVLTSPPTRQRPVETSSGAMNTQGPPVDQQAALVTPPEQEMRPLIERVRALEAEIVNLRAALADMRRENAAAMSSIRSQFAVLRGEYDGHKHYLDSGCISSHTLAPNTGFDGCVYVKGPKPMVSPMTGAPIKHSH